METSSQRIVRRHLERRAASDVVQRIEKIPGWERSNFLRSVHDQRRPVTDSQLKVIEKIESEQAARQPARPNVPANAIMLNPRKGWIDRHEINAIIEALREKPSVVVYDPRGIIPPNQQLQGHIVRELTMDFYGIAEEFAERNADEEDEKRHRSNQIRREHAEAAAHEMDKAKLHVKTEGGNVTLTLSPAYPEVWRRHNLG